MAVMGARDPLLAGVGMHDQPRRTESLTLERAQRTADTTALGVAHQRERIGGSCNPDVDRQRGPPPRKVAAMLEHTRGCECELRNEITGKVLLRRAAKRCGKTTTIADF